MIAITTCQRRSMAVVLAGLSTLCAFSAAPSHADNTRLNNSVVASVYTVRHQHGCTNDVTMDPGLQGAAQRHAVDVLNHPELDGEVGSDATSVTDRAYSAGFTGTVAETVAINPGLAINSLDVLNQWYRRPDYLAVIASCDFTVLGVWSENSWNRSVVVAVYGRPQ